MKEKKQVSQASEVFKTLDAFLNCPIFLLIVMATYTVGKAPHRYAVQEGDATMLLNESSARTKFYKGISITSTL